MQIKDNPDSCGRAILTVSNPIAAVRWTAEERDSYAGYWHLPMFRRGFNDYNNRTQFPRDNNSVDAQAYDRGQECAMMRTRPPQTSA